MFNHCLLAVAALPALAALAAGQTGPAKGPPLKEVTALVEGLKQKAYQPRLQAFLRLMTYRPLPKEIAPTLAQLVASETGYTRTLAACALAEITPTDATLVKVLAEGLTTKDIGTIPLVLNTLERLGPLAKPALPGVLAVLETGHVNMKVAAIPVVARMGKDAVAPLEKIILKAVEARKKNDQAAVALGKVGEGALPTILRLFEMDDPLADHHAALAVKWMEKMPPEVLKPMLRLSQHKDFNMRRSAYDYLLALKPPPAAATDALWAGLEDADGPIASKCLVALRSQSPDRKKWIPALKKYVLRYSIVDGGNLSALHELYQLDRHEAEPLLLPIALRTLGYAQQSRPRIVQLATFEKELAPQLSKIYPLLDGQVRGSRGVPHNVIAFLTLLAPEHTLPVQGKLQAILKAPRWEIKLAAATALLRTEKADTGPIARTLGEVLTVRNLPFDFRWAEVLGDLRRLGPDAKAALPALRVAQANAAGEVKGLILLTMAAIDPAQKDDVAALARRLAQSKTDGYVGAAVLLELGAPGADEALRSLGQALDAIPTRVPALRLLGMLGAKARPLQSKLEVMAADPKNLYPTQTALALGKVTGDRKAMFARLLQIAKDDPLQFDNVLRALALVGPDARPLVPALFELAGNRTRNPEFREALAVIDPQALNRLFD